MRSNRVAAALLKGVARLGLSPFISLPVGPYRLVLDVRHHFHALMICDAYEKQTESFMQRVLRPGDTYVDIGAEVGYLAAIAAAAIGREGRMILFEPDPRVFPRLSLHLQPSARPAGAPQVQLRNQACSDREGSVALELAPLSGQSRLTGGSPSAGGSTAATIVAVRADRALEQESVTHVRLLKIDVEGHEVSALRGLEGFLERRAVDFIAIEKHRYLLGRSGYTPAHLHTAIARYGYVGAHEDGALIDVTRLDEPMLENLIYARTPALLREAFPDRAQAPAEQAHTSVSGAAAMADAWEEIQNPNHPNVISRMLIDKARQGFLPEAIEQGEALLGQHPELLDFRGHLASWLRHVGQAQRARAHYELIHAQNPADEECRRILQKLRAEQNMAT